jgi:hypothetical protein
MVAVVELVVTYIGGGLGSLFLETIDSSDDVDAEDEETRRFFFLEFGIFPSENPAG